MRTFAFCPAVVLERRRESDEFSIIPSMVADHCLSSFRSGRERVGPGAYMTRHGIELHGPLVQQGAAFVEHAQGSTTPFLYELASLGMVDPEGLLFAMSQLMPGRHELALHSPLNLFAFHRQSLFFLVGTCADLDGRPAYGTTCDIIDVSWTTSANRIWNYVTDVYTTKLIDEMRSRGHSFHETIRRAFTAPPAWPGEPALCRIQRAYQSNAQAGLISGTFAAVKPSRALLWHVLTTYAAQVLAEIHERRYVDDAALNSTLAKLDVPKPGEPCPF